MKTIGYQFTNLSLILLSLNLSSQEVTLTLKGQEESTSSHVLLDSILVVNVTTGLDILLVIDTVLLLTPGTSSVSFNSNNPFDLKQNYPNT